MSLGYVLLENGMESYPIGSPYGPVLSPDVQPAKVLPVSMQAGPGSQLFMRSGLISPPFAIRGVYWAIWQDFVAQSTDVYAAPAITLFSLRFGAKNATASTGWTGAHDVFPMGDDPEVIGGFDYPFLVSGNGGLCGLYQPVLDVRGCFYAQCDNSNIRPVSMYANIIVLVTPLPLELVR